MSNTPLITFRLEERDNRRLRRLAAANKQTVSMFIRMAIKREMDRQEEQETQQ